MSKISIQDLKEERAFLERKLTILNLMIDAYSEGLEASDSPTSFESSISEMEAVPDDNFPYHKKWIDRILYLLDVKNRFLSNHELAESLMPYYPEYNIDKLKRKVSVTISAAYKNSTIEELIKLRVTNLPKGNVWGYKKWLDVNGGIIKKHRPFELSEKRQMTIYSI